MRRTLFPCREIHMYMQYQPNRLASGISLSAVSIHINLFFLRIMMEHSIFLQAGFTPKDKELAATADGFKNRYALLLKQAVALANGILSESALGSQQYVTPFTLDAERKTTFFTGISIDTSITAQQKSIRPEQGVAQDHTDEKAKDLSRAALRLTEQLADFKKRLLLDVTKCKMYTANYSMEIHHMWEEADKYIRMLEELETGKNVMNLNTLKDNEMFFAHIMSDHSRFTANRLDPYEMNLIQNSLHYAEEFDTLFSAAKSTQQQQNPIPALTGQMLDATLRLQDFQIQTTRGIMDCSIQSLILPLRSDHHMRETYFFIWLLQMAQKSIY